MDISPEQRKKMIEGLRRAAKLRRTGVDIKCETCGREFYLPPYRIRDGSRFCSRKCITRSPEQRKMMSVIGKSIKRKPLPHAYKKGHIPWNKGVKGCFSEEILNKIRRYRVSQIIPSHFTSIERRMKEELDRLGLRYIHQYNLDDKFVIDFAFPDIKVGIECDGDYWHTLPRNIRADKMKNGYCNMTDWLLLRFPEETINKSIKTCIHVIMLTLKERGVVFCI